MQDLIKLQRATIDEHIRAESAKDWEAVYDTFSRSEEPYYDVVPLAMQDKAQPKQPQFISERNHR